MGEARAHVVDRETGRYPYSFSGDNGHAEGLKQGGTILFSGDKGCSEGLPVHSVHSDREFSRSRSHHS